MMQGTGRKCQYEYVCDTPLYGVNYNTGYTGFTCTVERSAVSKGIAWFSRWDQLGDISVTHTLTVTGQNSCEEALIDKGVVISELSSYFDDPNTLIFFRKPVYYDRAMARRITQAALSQLGIPYDMGLIKAHALRNSYLGRLLSLTTKQLSDGWIVSMLDDPRKWICSELCAFALNHDSRLHHHGVLENPVTMITPQALFECNQIYKPWKFWNHE